MSKTETGATFDSCPRCGTVILRLYTDTGEEISLEHDASKREGCWRLREDEATGKIVAALSTAGLDDDELHYRKHPATCREGGA